MWNSGNHADSIAPQEGWFFKMKIYTHIKITGVCDVEQTKMTHTQTT